MLAISKQNRLEKMLRTKLSNPPQVVRATYSDENNDDLFVNYGLSFYIGKKKGKDPQNVLRFFLYVMENNYTQDGSFCYNWFVEATNRDKRFDFARGWISDPISLTYDRYPIVEAPVGYQDIHKMDIYIQIYNKPGFV
jgi:hypothetical protein